MLVDQLLVGDIGFLREDFVLHPGEYRVQRRRVTVEIDKYRTGQGVELNPDQRRWRDRWKLDLEKWSLEI